MFSFQEKHHFISDIPIFKARDHQSFDEWFKQVDKYTSLRNKDPHTLALAKSQGSFSRMISSFPSSMDCHNIKEHLCYNFCSITTNSMWHQDKLTHDKQQLRPYKNIYKDFQTSCSNPAAYYCIRQKIWSILHISLVIYITKNCNTTCYVKTPLQSKILLH